MKTISLLSIITHTKRHSAFIICFLFIFTADVIVRLLQTVVTSGYFKDIMNEQELLRRLKQGDEDAFNVLYKLYWPKVYNFSRLYISLKLENEEIVQEVFVKLWEVREFINEEENFKGFLFIITRNLIFNYFRRSFNENVYKATVLNSAFENYDIDEAIETSDLQEYIRKLISELTPRQQEIFRLSREEHCSYKEIADHLSISEKTVERHINDALKFLRKNIHLLFFSL